MTLQGKKILVVGASSALEKVIVKSLIEAGASLVILDIEATDVIHAESVQFNIFDNKEIEEHIPQVVLNFGKFDSLLYCVTHSDFRPLGTVKHDILVKIMNENFFSFIDILRTLVRKKGLNDGASILAMSSISSIRAMKAKMAFCSAKAALDAAVRCLAVELASKGIRVNTIQKGIVNEDFAKGHIQSVTSINEGGEIDRQLLGITDGIEVANAVKFLLSDQTKTITGTSLVIDGGYTT